MVSAISWYGVNFLVPHRDKARIKGGPCGCSLVNQSVVSRQRRVEWEAVLENNDHPGGQDDENLKPAGLHRRPSKNVVYHNDNKNEKGI
jgi:hypothetical protein